MNKLKAGSASVPVVLGADCFPNLECVGQHDDVNVRCMILESNKKFAILSVDVPSMHPADVRECAKLLQEKAGVDPDCCWVTVSHSFAAPHLWRRNHEDEEKSFKLPPVFFENPELESAANHINQAYFTAVELAIERAHASVREAVIGFGTGACGINVNRNMKTVEGWWQGVNHEGYVDHALPVVRIDDLTGRPIAILYNYSCQAGVASGPILPDGGKLVSSDLPGAASAHVERAYADCTAIFLPGATADQVPLYKINYTEVDAEGRLKTGSYGEAGYLLLEEQGRMLGEAILRTVAQIQCREPEAVIRADAGECELNCQKREADMSRMKPSLAFSFVPNGTTTLPICAVLVGDIAFVGLIPEMDGINIASIRERSPFPNTIVATFVNGNEKSMPQRAAYPLYQYGAMNSPFVEGSAEQYCDAAVALLHRMAR